MAQRGERRAARASQHLEARAHESPERRHRRGGEGIERLFEEDLALHAVARRVARRGDAALHRRDALSQLVHVERGLHAPRDERDEQRRRGARRVQSAEQPLPRVSALVILWVLWELVRSCFAGDRDDREKQD